MSEELEERLERQRRHVFFTWSAQRKADPLLIERAEGAEFWTAGGKRWIDFESQVFNGVGTDLAGSCRGETEKWKRLWCTYRGTAKAPWRSIGTFLAPGGSPKKEEPEPREPGEEMRQKMCFAVGFGN